MTFPFVLPDWLPWWVTLVLIVPCMLYGLALLVMPFAVLGVKSRLDAIDLRLDEIQGEIRALSLRMREPVERRQGSDEVTIDPPSRPPIPPAHPLWSTGSRGAAADGVRTEPRLSRPR